jgi:hypothetical protein
MLDTDLRGMEPCLQQRLRLDIALGKPCKPCKEGGESARGPRSATIPPPPRHPHTPHPPRRLRGPAPGPPMPTEGVRPSLQGSLTVHTMFGLASLALHLSNHRILKPGAWALTGTLEGRKEPLPRNGETVGIPPTAPNGNHRPRAYAEPQGRERGSNFPPHILGILKAPTGSGEVRGLPKGPGTYLVPFVAGAMGLHTLVHRKLC